MTLRALVTEYICGTDLALLSDAYRDLLIEGYSMLYFTARDLSNAGCKVSVLLHSKLKELPLPLGVEVIEISEDYFDFLERIYKNYDYILAIAPPLELMEICSIVGDKYMGPEPRLVELFSDKWQAIKELKELGFSVPKTILLKGDHVGVRPLKYPVVIKPSNGAGGTGITMACKEEELERALRSAKAVSSKPYVLLQELIDGIHASISIITSSDHELLLVSSNAQLIEITKEGKFRYRGGVLPLRYYAEKAVELARRLIKAFPGLRGYFGVDVVWRGDVPYIMEINPRITTSYLGLSRLIGSKLGLCMIGSMEYLDTTLVKHVPLSIDTTAYYITIYEKLSKPRDDEVIMLPSYTKRSIVIGTVHSMNELLREIERLAPDLLLYVSTLASKIFYR
ncbi:MAG: hypothetical protein DRN15_05335 [Thermoprotei archaeon]|nr:MAG: hypothetical protein DRM97_06595 [Thermoprotei archaeon]RLF23738.1 MAG: hypothetical protein DRN15_05335 [Thermoprotei archaeon]